MLSEEIKCKISISKYKKVLNLDTNKKFNSIEEAAIFYGICRQHISGVCKGKRKTCGGYRWKYCSK